MGTVHLEIMNTYFMRNTTRPEEAILDSYVAPCSPENPSLESRGEVKEGNPGEALD